HYVFCLYASAHHCARHSFPTRRSSDLIENGADAIYFGLSRFNARMRAGNFTEADLPELMAFLHKRGAKGYLTFNTLVFEDELEEDRKSTRLNSSHVKISYAVFCLKKKK